MFGLFKKNSKIQAIENQASVSLNTEALECKVCYDIFDSAPFILQCGHSFCLKCIEAIRVAGKHHCKYFFICPICSKRQYNSQPLIKNFALGEVLDHVCVASPQTAIKIEDPFYETWLKKKNNKSLKKDFEALKKELKDIEARKKRSEVLLTSGLVLICVSLVIVVIYCFGYSKI